MKTLTVVGNGFDLGHGLPTTFDKFIYSNPDIFVEKYSLFSNGKNSWQDVEKKYGEQLCKILDTRSWVDVTEVVEEILNQYGLNQYGEVDYYNYKSDAFDEEFQIISSRVNLLSEFEHDFQDYLTKTCSCDRLKELSASKNLLEILMRSNRVISFNYTDTIELVYGVDCVDHIHGRLSDQIAIGSGTLDEAKESMIDIEYPTIEKFSKDKHGFTEMMAYYDEDMDGNRVENTFIRRFFDEVVSASEKQESKVFEFLDIKNKDALSSRQNIIRSLRNEKYDQVYIIGHSLGEADYAVFDAIDKSAAVTCFYHSEYRKSQMESMLNSLGLKHTMISDTDLYRA